MTEPRRWTEDDALEAIAEAVQRGDSGAAFGVAKDWDIPEATVQELLRRQEADDKKISIGNAQSEHKPEPEPAVEDDDEERVAGGRIYECVRLTRETGQDYSAECFELSDRFGFDWPKIEGWLGEAQTEYAKRVETAEVLPPERAVAVRPSAEVVAAEDVLKALNHRHAIIDNVGNRTVIAGWEPSPLNPERLVVVFQGKDSFLLRYLNRTIKVEYQTKREIRVEKVPVGEWWLTHPDRRQYRGVTFEPNGRAVIGDCLNLWRGWGVEAKAGDWGLMRRHIEEVIAGGNAEFAEYVIRWHAWSFQNPGRPAEVALVLIGEKGTGKGTLARWLEAIFDPHAFQVTNREEVIGKFNGHLQDCILFIADEAYWGGDKRCVGTLQGMITEPNLSIERKGYDLIPCKNRLHVVMLAEPGWVIPAGKHERRYAALTVSSCRRGNRDYFNALHQQIAGGGPAAMFHDLLAMDLGGWHPREIPQSVLTGTALQRQQILSLPPMEQWYIMLLHEGTLPGGAVPNHPTASFTRDLREDIVRRVPRLRGDISDIMIQQFLTDRGRIGLECLKCRTTAANGWSFPPLSMAREAWAHLWGPVAWDNPEAKEWDRRTVIGS
jgi:hypothetical protein